jgi:hypothetical protein
MAEIIRTNGEVLAAPPPAGDGYTLDEVKTALGFEPRCYIEKLPLGPRHALLIDEDGKAKGRPLNRAATLLALGLGALFPDDYIVGNALLVNCEGSEWL